MRGGVLVSVCDQGETCERLWTSDTEAFKECIKEEREEQRSQARDAGKRAPSPPCSESREGQGVPEGGTVRQRTRVKKNA